MSLGIKKNQCFVLSVLVIYLLALRSSLCPPLSSLYGKQLHSPCSPALALWIGPAVRGTMAEARRVEKEEKVWYFFLPFLHLLCGFTPSELALCSMVLALDRDPLYGFSSCQIAPLSRLW